MRCASVNIQDIEQHYCRSLCAHDYLKRSPTVIQQELDAAGRTIKRAEKKVARLAAELAESEEMYKEQSWPST